MQSVFIICYVHLDLPFSFVWYSPYALNTVPLDIISVCQRRIISAQRSGACSFWRRRCVLVDGEEFGLPFSNSEPHLRVHKRSHSCLKPQLMLLKGRSIECPPILFILSIQVKLLPFATCHGWLARCQKC